MVVFDGAAFSQDASTNVRIAVSRKRGLAIRRLLNDAAEPIVRLEAPVPQLGRRERAYSERVLTSAPWRWYFSHSAQVKGAREYRPGAFEVSIGGGQPLPGVGATSDYVLGRVELRAAR